MGRPRSRLAGCGALVALVAACVEPYRPFCRVGEGRELSASNGTLRARAQGRMALLSSRSIRSADGGFSTTQQAIVEGFGKSGASLESYTVELPSAASSFGLFETTPFVDTLEGVAVLRSAAEGAPSADGGVEVRVRKFVEFRARDGGLRATELVDGGCAPLCRICDCAGLAQRQLHRVGDNVLVEQTELGQSFSVIRRFRAFTSQGDPLPQELEVADGEVLAGGDALAVFPGPRLFSSQLAPLSVAPPQRPQTGLVAWSLAGQVLVTAFLEERDLLVHGSDFSGATEFGPSRVSDGYQLLSVARSATGTGILFLAGFGGSDGGAARTWFAFVDRAGVKKGPDVPVSSGDSPFGIRRLAASEADDRFGVFTQRADGLGFLEVICE